MLRRRIPLCLSLLSIPAVAGADVRWLVTTHSGNDVLCFSEQGEESMLVSPGAGGLEGARGLLVTPDGDLLVACSKNEKSSILRYSADGKFKAVFATGGGLIHPYDLTFGPDGNLYVSGQDDDAVSRYDGKTGKFIDTFVPKGTGGLATVRGIAFGPDKNLYVASRDTDEVIRYDGKTGKPIGPFVTRKSGGLKKPIQIHFGPDGNLYVGSSGTDSVLRYDGNTGKFLDAFATTAGNHLHATSGFSWDPGTGDLVVASRLGNQVLRFDGKTGKFKSVFLDKTVDGMENPEFVVPVKK